MIVAVASAGRANQVLTLGDHWPKKWKANTYLVVPECEYNDYRSVWPNIITHPNINRLSPTRDWINDTFGDCHILHADDDSKFYVRDTGAKATPEHMEVELDWFAEQLRAGFVYVGMGFRWMSQDRPEIVEYPPGISNFYGVNVRALNALHFRFSQVELLQGLHLAITVAKSGYRSRMAYRVVYHQPVVNAPGGCSRYRTGDMYDRAAEEFVRIHGHKYISTRTRHVKWSGMEGDRTLIRVNWRRIHIDHPSTKLWEEQ